MLLYFNQAATSTGSLNLTVPVNELWNNLSESALVSLSSTEMWKGMKHGKCNKTTVLDQLSAGIFFCQSINKPIN